MHTVLQNMVRNGSEQTFNSKWKWAIVQYTWEVYDPCTVITLNLFEKLPFRCIIYNFTVNQIDN
jgi:hypothetical protein